MKKIFYLTGNVRVLGIKRFYHSLRLWYHDDHVQIAFCYYDMPLRLHDQNMTLIENMR